MAVANYALVVLAARNRRYKPVTASSVQKFWYLVHALAAISLFYFRFRRQFVQSIMGATEKRRKNGTTGSEWVIWWMWRGTTGQARRLGPL